MMASKLATIGYELRGFIRRDEESIIVMAERGDGPWGERKFATWEYAPGSLYTGHYDLTFNEARHDMAKRAGLNVGELEHDIMVQSMRVDDGARIRPGRRG